MLDQVWSQSPSFVSSSLHKYEKIVLLEFSTVLAQTVVFGRLATRLLMLVGSPYMPPRFSLWEFDTIHNITGNKTTK